MLFRGLKMIRPLVHSHSLFRAFASLPKHETLIMPALSPTMTEGTIVKWNKKEGDKVKAGEIMFEVETDKAVVGYEVQDDTFIAKILSPAGSAKIPLGHPVAILVDKADRVAAFKDYSASQESAEAPAPQVVKEEAKAPVHEDQAEKPKTDRTFISPIAKNLAKENTLDYKDIKGSGPAGRIVKDDIIGAISKQKEVKITQPAAQTEEPSFKDVPHTSMRKVTADRLLQSKQSIPHYYLTSDCRVGKLINLRTMLNNTGEVKVSINDLVIKAAALALVKVPEVNSSWTEEALRLYSNIDISIAVQTPKGLITPIIKNAQVKRVGEIAKEVKELAALAKEGKLKPEQFIGGTFTISNLGMFGIKQFSAIINPPQACILAVGASEGRVVPEGEGFKVENFMTVTLSCDHRVVDGAIGANWLNSFKDYIEEPYSMLL